MTMLPAASSFTGATVSEGAFKSALTSLRAFLFEKLGDDGSVAVQSFPSGTTMLFVQSTAPVGWTKSTTHNNKALRVVSGAVGSGGTVAFSTVFGRTATDGHTLTLGEMTAHAHAAYVHDGGGFLAVHVNTGSTSSGATSNTQSSGGGGAHSHNIDLRVQYVDAIIAIKD